MNFVKDIKLCNYHHNHDIEHFHFLKKLFIAGIWQPLTTELFSVTTGLPSLKFCINGIL